jgi:hypothetical protein
LIQVLTYSPRNLKLTKFNPRGNEVSQPSFLATFACKTNNWEKAIRGLFTISCCHYNSIFNYPITKKLDKATTNNIKEERQKE